MTANRACLVVLLVLLGPVLAGFAADVETPTAVSRKAGNPCLVQMTPSEMERDRAETGGEVLEREMAAALMCYSHSVPLYLSKADAWAAVGQGRQARRAKKSVDSLISPWARDLLRVAQ